MKQQVRMKGMDFVRREVKPGNSEGYYHIRDYFQSRKSGLVFVRHDSHYPYDPKAKGWGTHTVSWCCPGVVKRWGTLREVVRATEDPNQTTP
jgi:hypothetical protein